MTRSASLSMFLCACGAVLAVACGGSTTPASGSSGTSGSETASSTTSSGTNATSSTTTTTNDEPPAQNATPATTDGDRPTLATRIRLGHYSTTNGSDGFVLDRTAEPALLRRDGSPTIYRLNREPSVRGAFELRHPDGIWLRVYEEEGGYPTHRVLYDGPNDNEGMETIRDQDAQPLPR